MSELLPIERLGYSITVEDKEYLEDTGSDVSQVMKAFENLFPVFNIEADPTDLVNILNQSNQGACVGHAGATLMGICYFLATGRWLDFSRACCYYVSQKYSNFRYRSKRLSCN